MADDITSNILLQALVPEPKGTGIKSILADLQGLSAEMDKIAARTVEINIRANIDTTGLKDLLNSSRAAASQINNAVGSAVSSSVAAGKQQIQGLANDLRIIQRSITTNESGLKTGSQVTAKTGTSGLTVKTSFDEKDELKKQVETQKDLRAIEANRLEQDAKSLDLKRQQLDAVKKTAAAERSRLTSEGFERIGGSVKPTLLGRNGQGENVLDLVQTDSFQKIQNGVRRIATVTENARTGGNAVEGEKVLTSSQNAAERERQAEIARRNAIDRRLEVSRKLAEEKQAQRELEGFTFGQTKEAFGKIGGEIVSGEKRIGTKEVFNSDGTLDKTKSIQVEINTLTGAESRLRTVINAAEKESLRLETERKNQLKESLDAQIVAGNIKDKRRFFQQQGFQEVASSRSVRVNNDGTEEQIGSKVKLVSAISATEKGIIDLDTATGKYTVSIVANTEAVRQAEQAQKKLDAANASALHKAKALEDGFTQLDSKIKTFANGSVQSLTRFQQVSGNALSGYVVNLRDVNDAQGTMVESTLRGAQALRYVGDSFVSAAAKVSLWIAATTAVFGSIAAFKLALQAVKDLEAGTVLLARVGANLTGDSGATFDERYKAAKRLTTAIVEQSQILGVSAVESQKAAAVFLRGQQTEFEALQSTKAAMLASRIAELSVADAAELLSSAQAQFNINGTQTLSLLDQLNSLSNRYRVTTDSLLQSISRSGSVFAEQGGRLSELAALTATISHVTNRTGAEIGNALKTIESRLVSLDTQNAVFTKAGIAINNEAGEVKSLTSIILELQSAFGGLTEVEQNSLSVSIAGVRQRNLLVAAINNAAEAVIAEASSLRDTGSATKEASESNKTLQVSLGRVQSAFIQLAQSASGPGLFALKSVIDAITGLLVLMSKFNSATGNVVVILGLMLVAFKVVGIAVSKLGVESLITGTALRLIGLQATEAGKNVGYFGISSVIAAGGVKFLSLAEKEALATTIALNVGLTLVSGGISLVIALLSLYAYSQVKSNEESEKAIEFASRQAEEDSKRALASRIVTEALIQEAGALKDRNEQLAKKPDNKAPNQKAEAKTRVNLENDKKRIEGDINKLLKNLNIDPSGKAEEAVQKDIDKAVKVAQSEARAAVDSAVTAKKEAVNDALGKSKDFTSQEVQGLANSRLKGSVAFKSNTDGFNDVLGLGPDLKLEGQTFKNLDKLRKSGTPLSQKYLEDQGLSPELAKKVLEATNALAKATKDGDAAIRKANEDLAKTLNFKRNSSSLIDLSREIEVTSKRFSDFKKQQPIQREIGEAIGIPQGKLIATDLREARKSLTEFESELKRLHELNLGNEEDNSIFQRVKKQAEDAALSVEKMSFELKKFQLAQIKGGFERRQDSLSSLALIAKEQQLRINRSDRRAPESTADVERLTVRGNELRSQIKQLTGSLGDPKESSEASVKNAVNRVEAEKLLVELQKNEIDRAAALLKLNADISVEKKKQTDEAAKAIGLLSTEDKITALAIAQDFQENPNKKISFDQQFFGDAKHVALGRQFFGSRFEDGFGTGNPNQKLNPGSALGQLFQQSGAGISADLQRAIDANDQLRIDPNRRPGRGTFGKLTDEDIYNNAKKASDVAEQARLALNGVSGNGRDRVGPGDSSFGSDGSTHVDLNVSPLGIGNEFGRLVETFEKATTIEVQNAVDTISGRIDQIWGYLRTLPGRGQPQTNPNAGGP